MIGLSCYILVDTFFISKVLGALGIAALNFSISVYSVIHGLGLMIGIGGATRYCILKSQNQNQQAVNVFNNSLKVGLVVGFCITVIGMVGAEFLALLLGSDRSTLALTTIYLRTILCFAPFFIINNVLIAFVRNDNNPNLAMLAMLIGSFSNIILDYLFMFQLRMGMFGAAIATCLAPIISIGVLLIHFNKTTTILSYTRSYRIEWNLIRDMFSLGSATFIVEVSSAIVLITFNLVIVNLKGNLGVAAYGIIANIALVGIAMLTGIAQGAQPLISEAYGLKRKQVIKKLLKFAFLTSILVSIVIYLSLITNADGIIKIFNSQGNFEVANLAKRGIEIYFIGFLFASINIIMTMYLSAIEYPKMALMIAVLRGCVILVPLVFLLSSFWKMTGVWLAFVLTELIVTIIILGARLSKKLS